MKKQLLVALASATLLLGAGCIANEQPAQNTSSTVPVTGTTPTAATPPGRVANRLDLSNQNLSKVPDYVFNQTSIAELNISNNQITGALQSQIGQLKNLVVLNMSNNKMTGVPAEVGQLKNLEVLNLSNNQLTGLPNELGNLQNLKTLTVSGNNYSAKDLDEIAAKLPTGVIIVK